MATPKKTTSAAASADGKRILDAIRQLVRALRLFDREAQAKHGITAAQMFMLHSLEGDEVLSLNQLAERAATDQSSASVVVHKLVEAGYVTRTARKDDRRRIELRLTAKGRAIIRKSPPPAQQRMLEAIATLKPRDRKALADSLEQFVHEIGAGGKKVSLLFEDER